MGKKGGGEAFAVSQRLNLSFYFAIAILLYFIFQSFVQLLKSDEIMQYYFKG